MEKPSNQVNQPIVPVNQSSAFEVKVSSVSFLNVTTKKKAMILLQMAHTMAVNAVINEFKKIRLLFIMAVNVHTYVTKNICNMLKLRAEQKAVTAELLR